ncbi:hypothetical protein JIG36_02040 [Actinoplanes sp. LDG1-06]|uniref:Uncharacterized protein n=1 Tax=Paractinoplanes ovalisporus TaxID=2810368 RepID=A0ABS2A3C0_9ACTN|nr:hypothetical protein [Actinoplanes ovalisporus]MBM2614336.1 hypothetical protein [Actinoplanes ovalisporus]
MKNTDTSAKEVVRKAVIQSTFRDLRTGGEEELLTSVHRKRRRYEVAEFSLRTKQDLLRNCKKLRRHGQLLRIGDVKRGDVLELEVILSADRTYQLVSAISSVVDIVKGREAFFGVDKTQYDRVVSMLEVIDGLLVGLVPIRGISKQFAALDLDGEDYLIHRDLVTPNSDLSRQLCTLEVVGVTSFSSYSRDLRRVLFADESYTTYARVESATLNDAWQPVKLANVLEKMSINVDEMVNALPSGLSAAAGGSVTVTPSIADWDDAVTRFGKDLAAECGVAPDAAALRAAAAQAAIALSADESLESRRAAFDVMVMAVEPQADREIVRRIRDSILEEVAARAAASLTPPTSTTPGPEESSRKLEVEFVAIYW